MRAEKLGGMQERVPNRYTAVCVCVFMCALAAAAEHLHNHQSATKMWGFDSGELGFSTKKKRKKP